MGSQVPDFLAFLNFSDIIVDTTVGEVDLFDGHDEEETRVFLPEEVVDGDEESEEFVADGREGRWVAENRTRRIRYCLPECDCERVRGRKCGCELRGNGLCSEFCRCDPSLCRTKRTVADDEDQ